MKPEPGWSHTPGVSQAHCSPQRPPVRLLEPHSRYQPWAPVSPTPSGATCHTAERAFMDVLRGQIAHIMPLLFIPREIKVPAHRDMPNEVITITPWILFIVKLHVWRVDVWNVSTRPHATQKRLIWSMASRKIKVMSWIVILLLWKRTYNYCTADSMKATDQHLKRANKAWAFTWQLQQCFLLNYIFDLSEALQALI